MKSSVTFARAPHSPAEGKMQQKLIFSFAEETSICSEMGLAGSWIALSLILDDKGVEKNGSGI